MSDYALVTGGSRNIGAAIAQRLKADGLKVITLDIIEPEHDASDLHLSVDLTDSEATHKAIAEVAAEHPVTRIVNNAGIVRPASFEDTRPEDVDAVLALNLRGTIVATQAVAPAMKRAGYGRIVNIASRVVQGKEHRTAYAASKAGLVGMTKTWALELGRAGITANVVGPGPIRTSLFEAANPPGAERTKKILEAIPVGRMGEPEDIADAVSFFASKSSGFVTGQVLYVCGGMTVGGAH